MRSGHSGGARSISCVVPCFNEASRLWQLLPQLWAILEGTQLRWEVGSYVVIDRMLLGNAVSGGAAIVASLMFLVGVQMISFGIVVARIHEDLRGCLVHGGRARRTGLGTDEA